MTRTIAILFFIWVILFLLTAPYMAWGQSNHTQHHAFYKNWTNQKDRNCCNDQDCGELKDEDERTTPSGLEVKVEGMWCKVQWWHYLKKGNAPNWASSHVCVVKNMPYMYPVSACERLLCYQPKPGI